MAECDANDLIRQACESGFTCRNEPEQLAILNQLLCNFLATPGAVNWGDILGTLSNQADLQAALDAKLNTSAAVGYTLPFLYPLSSSTPADSTTYFIGIPTTSAISLMVTYNLASIEVPKAGTIKRVFAKVRVLGTLGTGETVQHFIRINDTTDVGQVDLAYTAVQQSGANSVVSQAVVAGDMLALKIVTPAWVTNPTSVVIYGSVYIE